MGVVDDILRTQQAMAADRAMWEAAWRDCVDLCLPSASHLYDYGGTGASRSAAQSLTGLAAGPRAVSRSRELYDATAAWATERLAAGMESLITPRAQKWHGFSLDDPFAPDASDLEEEWLDRLRDYHFAVRYAPQSNFSLANQKALLNTVVLGTGITYLEENLGRRGVDPVSVPFFYKSIPPIEAYLGIGVFDDIDKVIRVTEWPARGAVRYFSELGHSVSQTLLDKANDPAREEQTVSILHCVIPREEAGEYRDQRRNAPFASFWIELDTKHLIAASGYFTFPYSVTWWDQTDGSAYGQSPVMAMLSNIKALQVMKKTALQAMQQAIKPPMATREGLYRERLDLNAGAVNPGYLDDSGSLAVRPIITAQSPALAEQLIEKEREAVREGLYVNLFATLVQNPAMSATEALIRANEKGELLGPAGTKIEAGIGQRVEREVDIVGRKGAFEAGSPLAPPPSLHGKNVGVTFTGPLARLRRMQELQGVQSVLGMAASIAQYDQSIVDRIDADATVEIVREIGGAPRRMFRTDDEVAERRQKAAQAMEQQAALMATSQAADAAGKAAPALKLMNEMRRGAA